LTHLAALRIERFLTHRLQPDCDTIVDAASGAWTCGRMQAVLSIASIDPKTEAPSTGIFPQ
jgi:hypothetical protein